MGYQDYLNNKLTLSHVVVLSGKCHPRATGFRPRAVPGSVSSI